MRAIITHPTKVESKSTLASIGIAKFLADTLGLPIKDHGTGKIEAYDVIFMVNGPPAFCNWREEMAKMVAKAKTFVFIQNDYTIAPPSQVGKVMRKRGWVDNKGFLTPPIVWGTIPRKLKTDESGYVNWNSIAFEPVKNPIALKRAKGLFYYGAYREGRDDYFRKYLGGHVAYPVTVSSSARGGKRFQELNPSIELVAPMDSVINELMNYTATVYMEDVFSHKHFCSPATRFYECLAAGVAQLIDSGAAHTLEQAGFHVKPWVVENATQVKNLLKRAPTIAAEQQKAFTKPYRKLVAKQVRLLYRKLEMKYG